MGLKQLRPRVSALPSRVRRLADEQGHSRQAEPWRAWYNLARWQRLRVRVFVRDSYTCQMNGCGQVVARPIADHIKRHSGDPALFWAEDNVQTLCKPCHDRIKQAEEARARRTGG